MIRKILDLVNKMFFDINTITYYNYKALIHYKKYEV